MVGKPKRMKDTDFKVLIVQPKMTHTDIFKNNNRKIWKMPAETRTKSSNGAGLG